ncbi:hypothetical protein ACFQDG_10050 [Natronoarchaeum mannanilyticum]|uniref:DUF7344 domain-containing protein n=1 Tax=Natronoarchaeum mannanilyticum TaxID=926360 RepID=A0AAV3TBJ3_9EURY
MANDHSPVLGGERRSSATDDRPLNAAVLERELELLGHERRRRMIQILENADASTFDRREIARRIAAAEAGADAASDEVVRRVECSLHHKHLPMLDEYGVVDYDSDAGVTTYSPSREFDRRVLASVE